MDESNSPTLSTTSEPYSHPETSQLLDLPPELVLGTIQLLSHEDLQTFSLLSQSCRQLAVPLLFCKVTYSGNVEEKLHIINQANDDIKGAIRELTLDESHHSATVVTELILFQLLKNLHKLRTFRWHRRGNDPTSLNELIASLQHCPLEHLEYWRPDSPSESVVGLSGLRTLALKLSHHSSLYDMILPSLSTLVELRIRFPQTSTPRTFDLLPLKPIGATLQKFFYKAHFFDPGVVDTIPVVFPHLTTLELMFWNTPQDPWKKHYDDALSRNKKLEYLAVFAGGSSFCDTQCTLTGANCRGCADHRAKMTHAFAMDCTELKRCTWDNRLTRYMFNVKPSTPAEGNNTLKVERDPSDRPRAYRQSWFRCVELAHN